MTRGLAAGVVMALARRPWLWPTAVRRLLTLARPRWWRRWPPVPAPDPEYLRFRLRAQYGETAREPAPADVVAYLEWCRGLAKEAR